MDLSRLAVHDRSCACRARSAEAEHRGRGRRRRSKTALFFSLVIGLSSLALLPAPSRARVFFGDLHAHSSLSDDATNPPDAFFRVARDVAGLDFVVLSDHDIFLTADEWATLKATAASYDVEGSFVAFSAIEWSQDFNHLNVYFLGDEEAYCPLRECRRAADFHDFYRSRIEAGEAAAQINHPASPGFLTPWDEMDDEVTTSVEVWNTGSEGSHEHLFGGALWALRAGFRLGLVGVSDDHHSGKSPPLLGTGLTGCHAASLSRGDLLEAIRARRCFATDGERIHVDLYLGETRMGGERSARIGERLEARVEVTATATPVVVEVVRNGDVVATRRCQTPVCDVTARVQIDDPSTFVYARVAQAGAKHAWSSPVWVRGECARGTACLRSRVVDGGGTASDCLSRWLLPGKGLRAMGSARPRISCRDGDATCDAASEAGACTFRLGLCFGADDASGGACAAGRPEALEVVAPADAPAGEADPLDRQHRTTLEAVFRAATISSDEPACTPLSEFRVPVGKRRLAVRAAASGEVDEDEVMLECQPARAGSSALSRLRVGRRP